MKQVLPLFAGLALCALLFSMTSCTDGKNATRTLESMGYSNVRITGYRFLGCGKDDVFRTGFEAVAPNGMNVRGVYCSGLLKGGTVRFF